MEKVIAALLAVESEVQRFFMVYTDDSFPSVIAKGMQPVLRKMVELEREAHKCCGHATIIDIGPFADSRNPDVVNRIALLQDCHFALVRMRGNEATCFNPRNVLSEPVMVTAEALPQYGVSQLDVMRVIQKKVAMSAHLMCMASATQKPATA